MDPDTGVVAAEAIPVAQPENTLDYTEENLEANIAAELSPPTDESAGEPEPTPAATPAPGEPEAAPATPVEEAPPAEADEGKMHRISQQNAQFRATLTKLGINPDGDTMEAINSGLVTPKEVLAAQQTKPDTIAPQASTATAPEVPLSQKINDLKSILNKPIPKEGFTSEDVQARQEAFMGVITAQAEKIDNIVQSQEENEIQNQANKSAAAINEVFNKEVVPKLPAGFSEEMKQTAATIFLATTDFANGDLVNTHGKDKAQTPNGYAFSATKVAPEFNAVIQAAYQAGMNSTNPTPTPIPTPNAPGIPSVVPLRPGQGGGSPPPPEDKTKYTYENMKANTEEYFANLQSHV